MANTTITNRNCGDTGIGTAVEAVVKQTGTTFSKYPAELINSLPLYKRLQFLYQL